MLMYATLTVLQLAVVVMHCIQLAVHWVVSVFR